MSKINCTRTGCKDVFHAFLVEHANYDGAIEIPIIKPDDAIPNRLISFSKAMKSEDYNQWVHFYEDDTGFERVWNRPRQYLDKLSKFNGVITPDFSLYRDMPLVMQAWNTYRGKALGAWWQDNGLHVLPNVRSGDKRSFSFCCNGVPRQGTICVGSHGCLKIKKEREFFQKGLAEIVRQTCPKRIVVYGAAPADVFDVYRENGIEILQFESEFGISRKAVDD